MTEAQNCLDQVFELIHSAELKAGRPRGSVSLLPVSKTVPLEKIKSFLSLQNAPAALGENYADELIQKNQALPEIQWHFIGPLQSRKIKTIASCAHTLQSLCRLKELKILASLMKCPKIYFQINVSAESQKNGCMPEELPELLDHCAQLGLSEQVAGLMCLPQSGAEVSEVELGRQFARLRQLRDKHLSGGILSMGMSQDLRIAILEGSDMVRLGTAIFGNRR